MAIIQRQHFMKETTGLKKGRHLL